MISVKEAQTIILNERFELTIQTVPLLESLNRVLAVDVTADRPYPPFNRAAMDGYAFRYEDFEKGTRTFEVIETVYAGNLATKKITQGQCYKIMTGAATPEEADTIIRVEDSVQNGNQVILSVESARKGQNIAKMGEDAKEGALILKKNTLIRPIEIGTLAALGVSEVPVFVRPIITIISTGDELVPIGKEVLSHQIHDSNRYALEGFLNQLGCTVHQSHIAKDTKDDLSLAIRTAMLHSDILLMSGGVSMGDADFVPEVLQEEGYTKVFHKVAIKPGKPLWFGKSARGVVFGLPGNPISVQVAFKLFIAPFIRNCFGIPAFKEVLKFPLETSRSKKVSFDEYFPFSFVTTESGTKIRHGSSNGSGDVVSLVHSDGIALHPASQKELQAGDTIEVISW